MRPTVVIITGFAGSGKTVALRALEDQGFYCVDNLPVTLMERFTSIITADSHNDRVGIGVDIREKEFLPALDSVLTVLREKYNLEIIFLEAEREAIVRRFKETRRPHPLVSEDLNIEKAIDMERAMLLPIRAEATRIIDTSAYTPHQLRHLVSSLFKVTGGNAALAVALISFGHKFGIPQNVDILFDVRFLRNPHFVTALKDLSGTDLAVQDFVFQSPGAREFMERTSGLLNFLIPQYVAEGKAYLTIGIGCTGGKHRSPAIAERMAEMIKDDLIDVTVIHRDLA
ncbi:MAG TPA: RNase adapter RapZ [Thermodesulfovibrionales bacterium]|nr:RNase adapter RapZ [Thermodesulfovibrionales bacterium]